MYVLLGLSGGIIIICGILMACYVYQIVLIDATNRNLKHPHFWALFSTSSNGGGLMAYLFHRRHSTERLSPAVAAQISQIKFKIGCLLTLDLVAFVVAVIQIVNL